nr:bifunctional helix-turn-helix transcriptional regulator/GNAT family N-acetyltransferase [uncultured Haemophilus sp.]
MKPEQLSQIRLFNRFYADQLNVLDRNVYNKPYSLAGARVITALYEQPECTSTDLLQSLNMDGGFLSRLLKRFEDNQLLQKTQSDEDKRKYTLSLTKKGKSVYKSLAKNAEDYLLNHYQEMPQTSLSQLTKAMDDIVRLHQSPLPQVHIRTHRLGDAGYVAQLHGDFYRTHYQFKEVFDFYVLEPLSRFVKNPEKGELWVVEVDGVRAGSIAIVKETDEIAQLRWFILDEKFQGLGMGKKLMQTAVDFAKSQGYQKISLWTFSLLESARHLYRKFGFGIVETVENNEWCNQTLIEERWELDLNKS